MAYKYNKMGSWGEKGERQGGASSACNTDDQGEATKELSCNLGTKVLGSIKLTRERHAVTKVC